MVGKKCTLFLTQLSNIIMSIDKNGSKISFIKLSKNWLVSSLNSKLTSFFFQNGTSLYSTLLMGLYPDVKKIYYLDLFVVLNQVKEYYTSQTTRAIFNT